ncbi:MAG: metal-dependent hydrolase [Desulfovibrio sp.]|uniref:metal-dependent hydrolase n=1 Tax=Desulfovibrio sp. 7SRBS1 TaxID=3378064 RepID=UPI003B41A4F5
MTGGAVFAAIILGLLIWGGWYAPNPALGAILICISVLAALFPDVDTDSKGQSLYYGLLVLVDLVLMARGQYKWAAVLGLAGMMPAIGHHRGWTHTWWAMLLVPLPIILLPLFLLKIPADHMFPFYLAAVAGYFSHLLLDREF